ncbi:hypothetical protein GGR50DRAFT_659301 [Xylaria sp. CBS 124048]|nr:hypothetical protein GGR50DRAFT_659301 [Xylaria sp. CBS 124048]
MGTSRQAEWWEGALRMTAHWHKPHLHHLGLLVVIALSVSLLLFQTYHGTGGFTREKIISTETAEPEAAASEPESKPPEAAPGRCTTWPVMEDGTYVSNVTTKPADFQLQSFAPPGGWVKPKGVAVKAIIFFGRKRTVNVLDCYLQRNLAVNGGFLDEVWFLVHTKIQEDLDYLDGLVKMRDQYKIVNPGECSGFDFACMWNPVVEDDTIFIKIDDDIVFIHPDTIPQLVSTRLAEPHPFAVSANLVNSPMTGYKHYETGAIHPFLPDTGNKPSHDAAELWRPSDLRSLKGAEVPGIDENGEIVGTAEEIVNRHVFANPPYDGHPWLLLSDVEEPVLRTPMGINKLLLQTTGGGPSGNAFGNAWRSWMISAQQQYSLLRNLELNSMWRYHFGTKIEYPQGEKSLANPAALKFANPDYPGPGAEQLFDTGYTRYNLNFVAVWGHDIKSSLPIAADDEEELTATIPKRVKRPFVIDTRAVVGHLSFFPQHDGIQKTDLLDRWRAFANELICPPDELRAPFDPRCPGF